MSKKSEQVEENEEEYDPSENKRKGRDPVRDMQKKQLEKLMAHPERLASVPEPEKGWRPRDPPEFCRFYMGSSAGAGSEVFHVYRHLRRYELTRQQWIEESATNEDKDLHFMMNLAAKKSADEERTAKKRAKRLRKKQRQKQGIKQTHKKDEVDKEEDDDPHQEEDDDPHQEEEEEEEEHENCFVIGGR